MLSTHNPHNVISDAMPLGGTELLTLTSLCCKVRVDTLLDCCTHMLMYNTISAYRCQLFFYMIFGHFSLVSLLIKYHIFIRNAITDYCSFVLSMIRLQITTFIFRGGYQMGFLDSLLKKTVSKVVSETANSVANTINNSLSQAVGGSASSAVTSSAKKAGGGMLPGYEHLRNAMVEEKLDAVLAKEFPQYTVEREVSATAFGGLDTYMPYSYVIYDEVRNPKLIIMIVSHNTCVSAAYKRSRELSEANGFTLINFVAAFENRMDYIVNRLHQYL